MSIEVNRPGGKAAEKARLSKTGRIIAAVLVVAVVAIGAGFASHISSSKAKEEAKMPIFAAVDHSVTVCRGMMPETLLKDYTLKIDNEKDALHKAEAAQEMIAKAYDFTDGQVAKEDELNGARNRINLAVKNYKQLL